MQAFYAPDIAGGEYKLDENESGHCIRVLRMKAGSFIRLVDGKGTLFEGIVVNPDPKGCTVSITAVTRDFEKRDYRLHIAISPLKNPVRFEWFIEKSVEIGIDEITPVICDNTEKPGIKADRLRSLIISAMKQSLKPSLTRLNEACRFNDFIRNDAGGTRMIAHCYQDTVRSGISDVYARGSDALIMIGPEGDFSPGEVSMAAGKGFVPVHLGKSRLRSETAGIAACHSIYFINQ